MLQTAVVPRTAEWAANGNSNETLAIEMIAYCESSSGIPGRGNWNGRRRNRCPVIHVNHRE